MSEPLQPTPYAGVNTALHSFKDSIQAILGGHFISMYLSGSLALGDFDPDGSDIDFIVVTDAAVSEDTFRALREMHRRFDAGDSPWAAKVEAVYVTQAALRRHAPDSALYPQVEKGTPLFPARLESGWIFHLDTLRRHTLVVAGPDPSTLIGPVDLGDMRRAAAPIAEMWLDQAQHDPSWLEWLGHRENQAFVVLTLCRLLYTLDSGGVTSKPGAAHWAQKSLGARWTGLIERALVGKHASGPTPESDVTNTVALIRYTVDQFHP